MADKATVTFYTVSHCGYFKRKGDAPIFGRLAAVMADLHNWTRGLSLEETKTYDPPEASDLFPVYVADMAEKNGDWLIAMWNQVPESEGGIASIAAQSDVGSPEVAITELEEGRIPGFATYFWFLPNEGLFATIRLNRPFTGQIALQKYIRGFLRYYSSFVVHNDELKDADDVDVLGYKENPADELQHLIPRFQASLHDNPGDIDLIVAQADAIRQISRKEDLNLQARIPLVRWQRILRTIGVTKPKHAGFTEARLQYTADVTLTAQDVRSMASEWLKQGGAESGTDLGFRIKGESSPRWLSKSIARDEVHVTLERTMPEMFSLDALLTSLQSQRKNLLKLLK